MPTKIRLQRHGKKGRPFYHIVIADGREPRDGRFIERLGTYNPVTIPAEITLISIEPSIGCRLEHNLPTPFARYYRTKVCCTKSPFERCEKRSSYRRRGRAKA